MYCARVFRFGLPESYVPVVRAADQLCVVDVVPRQEELEKLFRVGLRRRVVPCGGVG